MSKSLLQTRIVDKLEVIMTQVDTMNKFGKNIPLIHLDILKSNIRTLYEQICELERAQQLSTSSQKTINTLFREQEPPVVSKETEERIIVEATETISKMVESIQTEIANEYIPEVKIELDPIIEPQSLIVETPVIQEVSNPVIEIKEEPIEVIETLFEVKEEILVANEEIVEAVNEESTEIVKEDIVEAVKEEVVESKEEVRVETTPIPVQTSLVEQTPLLQIGTIFEEEGTFEEEFDERPLIQSPIPDIMTSLQTIADRYKAPDSTLNEMMALSNVTTVNTAVKQIRDLKSSIGINEKFLFINELFKGNMKEYTDTIVMLSDAETLELAHEILRPLKGKYEWREDSSAYLTLIDFLQRRFV